MDNQARVSLLASLVVAASVLAAPRAAHAQTIDADLIAAMERAAFRAGQTTEPARRFDLTLDDAVEAEHMFTLLMSEHVEPRRAFIEENALSVKFLDV